MYRDLGTLKRLLFPAVVVLLGPWASAPGLAAPIVTVGSTYDLRFGGDQYPATVSVSPITFDGSAETLTVSAEEFEAEVTVTESQQDLGGGVYRIVVSLVADRNLALGNTLLSNVGRFDPFDLLRPVKMNKAVITFTGTFFGGGGQTVPTLSWDFTSFVNPGNPWLGTAPGGSLAVGFVGLSGDDLRGITFDLEVSDVPEPASLALLVFGLAVMVLRRPQRA